MPDSRSSRIVMGECGHAFRSVYDMGNRALGWKMPPIPVTHAIEFYYELLKAGKHQGSTKKYRAAGHPARSLQCHSRTGTA